ncbi:MAG: hypothetical protein NVSMB9_02160 [Isosphaeraceae bacterium]
MQTNEVVADGGAEGSIETGEGFVEQEHGGSAHKRPPEGHALLLTSRKSLGKASEFANEAERGGD